MLFNSLHFLIFFPIVAAVYFALRGNTYRKVWLLAGSLYFYCVFSVPFCGLMLLSVLVNYAAGLWMEGREASQQKRILLAALAYNLGILFTFKYIDFFSLSIFALTGVQPWPVLHLLLPMGISFYTFQAIAYVVDIYRGTQKAETSLLNFALFKTFFPQLVAGPIMRPHDLLPQFAEKHEINGTRILSGLLLIVWGLCKKIFVAEPMGDIVDAVYSDPSAYGGGALLLATYAFAIQIFCDFSAYTDIAIGAGRVLGFRLMENFRTPYLAVTMRDFWHRWHISLSTWLRDYLYIPLGGSRKSALRTYINLMITMLLGGLWHGASWNFVIWGALHGAYLAFERATGIDKIKTESLSLHAKIFGWIVTFHLICLAWIFFRAKGFDQAMDVLIGIVLWQNGAPISLAPLYVLAGLLSLHLLQNRIDVHGFFMTRPVLARWSVYIGMGLAVMAMMGGSSPEFIYFQF